MYSNDILGRKLSCVGHGKRKMRIYIILKAIISKEFTTAFRYKLELLSGLAFLIITLSGIVFGGNQLLDSKTYGLNGSGIISSFWLFFFTNLCIGNPPNECKNAINEGNLETISMFSIPLYGYLSLQTFFHVLTNIGTFAIAGIIVSIIMNIDIVSLKMLILIPFYFVSLLSGVGIGLMLAGLQLLYKKIGYVISLSSIVISFALAILPQTDNVLVELFPMKAFATIFKDVALYKNLPNISSILEVFVSSLFFYFLGIGVFNFLLKKAKVKGCMGVY